MTNKQTLDDLTYLRDMASAGENAPLIGGSIGLMWGVLLTAIFTVQWAILSGAANIDPKNLLFFWLAFAIIGGAGSAILGRRMEQKPGARSTANQVDSAIWIMFAGMMGTLFIGVMLSNLLGSSTPALFDFIVIAGFAGQGMAYGTVAKISKIKWMHGAALASFIASAVAFTAYGFYLVGAIGAIATIVIPSLVSMRHEPSNVV